MKWLLLFLAIPAAAQSNYVVEDLDKEGQVQAFKMNIDKKFDVAGGTITGKSYLSTTTISELTVGGSVVVGGSVAISGVVSGVGLFSAGDFKWKISSSSACGSGWIRADGSSLSTTTYSALFTEIGYMYGGTGANFTLPDMNNGEFIRAVSTATTAGWARTSGFGSKQEDAFQGHRHALYTRVSSGSGGAYNTGSSAAGDTYSNNTDARQAVTDTTNGTPRIDIETRPRNYAMLPCIYTGVP